ncbi:MAG TPA: hypothetical protein VF363_08830 [Candidatus Eisenbacteria bacterium]
MKRIGWLVLMGVLAVSVGACGRKIVGGEGDFFRSLVPIYPSRSTPRNALLYYKAAWENRDSTRIDTVLAEDYAGSSADQSETLQFSKADEIRALGGIQLSQRVTRVIVDLHDPSTWIWQYYAGDSAAWVSYSIPSPRIEVDDVVMGSLLADQSTFMEFTFRPTTPAPASPTDTLWTIVRWREQGPP